MFDVGRSMFDVTVATLIAWHWMTDFKIMSVFPCFITVHP